MKRPSDVSERLFHKHRNALYAMNAKIRELKLLKDGSLFLDFNGLRFFARSDNGFAKHMFKPDVYRYGNPKKLDRLIKAGARGSFGDFLIILKEVFIDDDYKAGRFLRAGDTVVDVGANVGIFTVKAAKRVGDKGRVIAIEPERENLKYLKRNVDANNLKNVTIIPKAAYNGKGVKKLKVTDVPGWHSLKGIDNFTDYRGPVRYENVETDTLDCMLADAGVKTADFIKIDTEGAEVEVLEGAKGILASSNPTLSMEVHMAHGKLNSGAIASFLTGRGYKTSIKKRLVYAKKGR